MSCLFSRQMKPTISVSGVEILLVYPLVEEANTMLPPLTSKGCEQMTKMKIPTSYLSACGGVIIFTQIAEASS